MTGIHLRLGEVEEISLKGNTNLERGEDIDRLLPPLLDHPLQTAVKEVKALRSLNNLIGGKEDDQHRLLLPLQQIIR